MEKLLSYEDHKLLEVTCKESEQNPLLINGVANKVYRYNLQFWDDFANIVAKMQERYEQAKKGNDYCAFARGDFIGLTSKFPLAQIPNYPHLSYNPNGAAARVFVEGVSTAQDPELVEHINVMFTADYQVGYMGCYPIMKTFLAGVDVPPYLENLNEETRKKERRKFCLQRKLVAIMQGTNMLTQSDFRDTKKLGLFYHIDGKVLMSSMKRNSLFDRVPKFKWTNYGQ